MEIERMPKFHNLLPTLDLLAHFQLVKEFQTAAEMDRNYKTLLRVEELKFSQGESSLFLINSRENKALETEEKIIALRAKYLKAVFAMQWAGGILR